MEPNDNLRYLKNIYLLIEKDGKRYKGKVSVSTFKNNELEISIDGITKTINNILFDANIKIIMVFNFTNINQDLLGLLFLIYGIKKYAPNSINLVLPYFPYTSKDILIKESIQDSLPISTDNSLLTMLQNANISSIKTFDLGNIYIQNYQNIFIDNITKDEIFIDEFNYFNRTQKQLTIILLYYDDYILFREKFGLNDNIKLVYLEEDISTKSKLEQTNILNTISNGDKTHIYIFEKSIIRGNKLYALLNILGKNLDIREIDICVTHGIFSQGTYRKFNTIIEKYPYINIVTTNSIGGYAKKINSKNIKILKLPLVGEYDYLNIDQYNKKED